MPPIGDGLELSGGGFSELGQVASVVRSQKTDMVCLIETKMQENVVKGGEKSGCW